MKQAIIFLVLALWVKICPAQTCYELDASHAMAQPQCGHFKMGDAGPEGKKLEVNSLYLTLNGKPLLPVMGEMHFSRIKRCLWEERILQMKACGVNIISTYLFWNHHEEIEGQFNWEGEKDLRAFIKLCAKHGLYTYPRLGPWSHGEARNGGTPDWILQKKYLTDRSNDVVYQQYVTRYFTQIAQQLKGLYYKDGGSVIGIQLENEYWYAKDGEPHIKWLKELAVRLGMDVPMYTVTGWGNGSVPPFEVIPLWGGYADAPWVEHVNKEYQPGNFMFDSFRDNKNIGNDQIDYKEKYMSYNLYPYFTCEMGVGVQNTYHRRLRIDPLDGLGMITAKLGSGSNLLGYYIFTGATQFRGELWSTEEEQEKTGYWSRVPAKSYDFQAAIRESGELSAAYKNIKKLHYFVNECAEELAPMMPVIREAAEDEMQLSVRSNNYSGFLFGINYARFCPKKVRKDVRFNVRFEKENITFPSKGITISDSTVFVWPLNYKMGQAVMKYATSQLISKVGDCYLFFRNRNVPVEFCFRSTGIREIVALSGKVHKQNDCFLVSDLSSGLNSKFEIRMEDGTKKTIVVLTEEEANRIWLFTRNGKQECYVTTAGMYASGNDLYMYATDKMVSYYELVPEQGIFTEKKLKLFEGKEPEICLNEHSLLADAQWLQTAKFKDLPAYQVRYHRFFFKEFNLDNPSQFRKATLYVYPETDSRMNLNDNWICQELIAGQLNCIDLTGYVKKGLNMLFLDFPFVEGEHRFAAKIVVEYYNYDRVELVTDDSWLTTDSYTNPSLTRTFPKPVVPVVVDIPKELSNMEAKGIREWEIDVPQDALEPYMNVYIRLKYQGNQAELYNDYTLSADDFNSNTTWTIGLKGQEYNVEGKRLKLILHDLPPKEKIYFDVPLRGDGKARIESFKVNYEYRHKLD